MKFERLNKHLVESYPHKGESKQEFIDRFMHETKDEYPDIKQRYAVALSYWEKRLTEADDGVTISSQEFSSAQTSINAAKLPAIFRFVKFNPNTINLDYGGGKFDNASEFLAQKDVKNLIFDPYNRTKEHNDDVLAEIRKAGGADTATLSNVLNVIKEKSVRTEVLQNIKKLLKPSGILYITVYEGSGSGIESPTKAGYQLNRKTAEYLDEIQEVFPDAKRVGKLIIASNRGGSAMKEDYDETKFELVDRKDVVDEDGFYTEYSWYRRLRDGMNIFIYGDSDIHEPDDDEAYWDYNTESDQNAKEWFSSYEGEELEESNKCVNEALSRREKIDEVADFRYAVEEILEKAQALKKHIGGRIALNMERYMIPMIEAIMHGDHGGMNSIDDIMEEVSEEDDDAE